MVPQQVTKLIQVPKQVTTTVMQPRQVTNTVVENGQVRSGMVCSVLRLWDFTSIFLCRPDRWSQSSKSLSKLQRLWWKQSRSLKSLWFHNKWPRAWRWDRWKSLFIWCSNLWIPICTCYSCKYPLFSPNTSSSQSLHSAFYGKPFTSRPFSLKLLLSLSFLLALAPAAFHFSTFFLAVLL